MRKTMLGSLTGLLIPFAAYAAQIGYGSYQRRQQAHATTHLPLSPVGRYKPQEEIPAVTDNAKLTIVSGSPVKELVIIDASVPDKAVLLSAIRPGIETVILKTGTDALEQTAALLKNYQNLDAVHLVSHGEAGAILLGDQRIDKDTLETQPQFLAALREATRAGADLLLYACDLASENSELLEVIQQNTHLDIAASNNLTGAAELGGDWALEIQTGNIETAQAFSGKALKDFSAVLRPFGSKSLDGWSGEYYADDPSRDWDAFTTYITTPGTTQELIDGESAVCPNGLYVSLYDPNSQFFIRSNPSGENFGVTSLSIYSNGGFAADTVSIFGYQEGNPTPVGTKTNVPLSTTPTAINLTSGITGSFAAVRRLRIQPLNGDSVEADLCLPSVTFTPLDTDGNLTAAAGVTEPVGLATTVDTVGEAVNVFDFTISDGGGSDAQALTVSSLFLNVSGTSTDAERGQITWRLNGPDASNVTGAYSAVTDRITFAGLSLSVADGGNETYTVNAYYNNNTGLTEDRTIILSVDGDTNLTVGASGTQMGSTAVVTNGAGTTIDVVATQLVFSMQPAGSVSGLALTTQPVVAARDAAGNTDVDFTETVTLTEASAGALSNNTQAAASGVATFTNLIYTATADQQSFTLTANDQDGVGSNLPTVDSNLVTSNVVATKLLFATQPAPTTIISGVATSFTTVPVVRAVNAGDIIDTGYATSIVLSVTDPNDGTLDGAVNSLTGTGDTDGSGTTVTLTPSSGVATYTGLQLTYTASGGSNIIALRGTSGGLTAANSSNITAAATPVVTDARISISGATGTGGAYRIDDIVTATWNNTAGGDNNPGITGVTVDFSQFGGGAAVVATNSSDTWTATYTIVAGSIDATNRNVSVTSTNASGPATTADTTNATVDNIRPTATLVVTDTALAAGETSLVTITFSEAVTGFLSADMLVANGTPTAVSSSDGGITWTATLTPTASITDATNVIRLSNTGAYDLAGNAGIGTTDSNNYAIDTARPTASIVVSDTALAAGETSPVTITFSEAVSGFTNADLTIANGALSAVSSSDGGITWTATFTPTVSINDATNVITLANTGVQDVAGNAGTGTTDSNNYAINTVRPTASIVVADTALSVGETSLVTITFSESVTGFTTADLTTGNGALTGLSSGDGGITWNATLTPTASITDATNVITLANTGVQNAAGNTGAGITDSNNYAIDTARPTAGIVVSDTALAAGETSLVTITFSETVTGFTNADLTVANGTLSAVSSGDGGITWTATLTPTASINDATNIITLDNTGVADAAGNAGSGTTDSNNYAIDTARPTAGIVVSDTALVAGETSPVTITFSEAVTGFTAADLTVGNGSVSGLSTGDGGITWTATLTPTTDINDATNIITLDNTGVADAAGNTGSGTTDSNNYAIDTARPTAGIVVSDTALAAGETSLVTITFSEAVTGFDNADLTIANGALSAVSSSDGGITWAATLTPTASTNDATNIITLDNTGVADAAGNTGTGTTDSNNYAIDTARPTAGIVVSDTALAAGETSLVTITFSEAVTGFANADLTIANGTLSAVSSSDGGITWTVTLTPTTDINDATNIITLDNTGVADAAGNTGADTTDSNNYAIDTARPTAGIVVSDTALAAGETSLVTITFSETVTGFANADLTIANGALSAVSSSDGGITWTATFTPTASINDATNVITLANTGVQDAAGNTGAGTTDSNNYAINTVRPTAGIVVSDTALAAGETSLVTITFSEAVTGFTNADLTIANGTLSAVSSSDGGITWTATFTPTASINDATNVITLANTGVQNTAGNTGAGTTDSNNYAIDTVRPTASLVMTDTALAAGETSLVTITFSETITGFTNADLTIDNGALSAVSSSDGGITWTATLTPTASINDATNIITLDNTGVADAAGNTGAGTTDSNNYAIDTARPTAGIVVSDTALAAGETSLVTITFSEAVSGFANADLTIANGTLSAVSSADGGITWTATLTPTASINDATNIITLDNTGVADAAGNTGAGTTDSNNYAIDTARPTAGIVVSDAALAAGETSLVTITFSETITGFSNADLTIDNGVLSAVSSGDGGITWTATLTPTASINDATNVITLDNTGVVDAAGNTGTGTTDSNNYAIDTARPTAGIVVSDTALAAGETSLVTITFSEAVTGFANADLTIANGTLTAVSSGDGGITWTATLTPTTDINDATNVITLANTGVQDAAGNTGAGTTDSNNYAIDTARPTAGIVVADTALAAGETSLVTITFSEAIIGLTSADLTIANGAPSAVSSGDGGITWTATLTPTAGINDATNIISLDNVGVQDAAGNTGAGSTESNNYAIDTDVPTASSVSLPANATYSAGQNLDFTVNYGDVVTVSGTPRLTLTIDAIGRFADYLSGSGTMALTFRYTVQAGDNDSNGISLSTALDANGGTIRDAISNNASNDLGTLGSLASVLVDTQAPVVATNAGLDVDEGESGIIDSTSLVATDNISAAANITFTVVTVPVNGTLSLNGSALANGNTFMLADINNNLVAYEHNGSATVSDSFGFTVHDAVNNLNNNSGSNFSFTFTIVPPEEPAITAPTDLDIDATGLYTTVTLRQLLGLAANASDAVVEAARLALASDMVDGANCCNPTALELSNGNSGRIRLAPGAHIITWRATDSDGNTAEDTQAVNIHPLVSLGRRQIGVEGGQVALRIMLNGLSPVYPLDVPYMIDAFESSGTLDSSDHDLVDGIATLNAGETEVSVTINLAADGMPEGDEVLVVRLDDSSINVGANSSQRITITEGNLPPVVTLGLQQNGIATSLVTPAGGTVTVTATANDPNGDPLPTYDWSMSDAAIIDTDGDVTDATFEFDPSSLNDGALRLHVAVGDGTAVTSAARYFRVVTVLPNMGVDAGDADSDGIPDYLDTIEVANVLPETAAVIDEYLMECEPGVRCRLGAYALLGSGGRLTAAQIRAQDVEADAAYEHSGGVFDFEVYGLPVAGQSVRVAIPLLSAIPRGAVYRKFSNDQWNTFVEDDANALHSAPDESGYCPPPGDAAWQSGLRAGHRCLQLTLEDGGPNDADGETNYSIADPGSVAALAVDETIEVYGIRSKVKGGGGGSLDGFILIALALLVLLRSQRARKTLAGALLLLLPMQQAWAVDWSAFFQDTYVELGIYQAKGSHSRGDLIRGLTDDGVTADVQTYDVSRQAYQLNFSYQYHEYFAARLGFLDLGDAEVDLIASTSASSGVLANSIERHYPLSAYGWVLANRFEYPVSARLSLAVDAGLYRWRSEIVVIDSMGRDIDTEEQGDTDPILGISANYRLTDRYGTGLGWQRVFFGGQEVDLWGINGVFHF